MYHVQDLGSFGGDLVGLAINRSGDIAGYAFMPDGTYHAIRWTRAGGLEDLGSNGGFTAQGVSINDNGDVGGVYVTITGNFVRVSGFIAHRGGSFESLFTPARPIVRVNTITNDGRLAGMIEPDFTQPNAFRTLADGTVESFGNPDMGSAASKMNAAGDLSGYEVRNLPGDEQQAFRYTTAAGRVDLGTLGGVASVGSSINSDGVVVGWATDVNELAQAFRARPGFPMERLDGWVEGSFGNANDINDAGVIVGAMGGTAFVYLPGSGVVQLESRVPSAERQQFLVEGMAVNESGQVVALYRDGSRYGTVLLTPFVDNGAPAITSASVSPHILRPADGTMRDVTLDVTATDEIDPAPVCRIVGVTNSQWRSQNADPSVHITGNLTVSLRASRRGPGDERLYTITVLCEDASGNGTDTKLFVRVPRPFHW